jgi:hypothetical protein
MTFGTIVSNAGKEGQLITFIQTFKFIHAESETFVDVTTTGQGSDYGDKAANKALTIAKKYALLGALLIITGEDADNHQSPDGSKTPHGGKKKDDIPGWDLKVINLVIDEAGAPTPKEAREYLKATDFKYNVAFGAVQKHIEAYNEQRKGGVVFTEAIKYANENWNK